MKDKLLARKSLADLSAEAASTEHGLRRVLGPWHLIFLGIGAIVGAGIFVITGHAAAQYAGPAVTLSFVLAGLTCSFAGLCYAEFASLIPIAGSAYTYAYATLGEFFAWIIGWDLILEYSVGATTVAIGWSGYIVSLLKDLGVNFPQALANAPFAFDPQHHAWTPTGALFNLPALFIIVLITALLVIGIKESASVNAVAPNPSAPILRNPRREMPSQNRVFGPPKIVSIVLAPSASSARCPTESIAAAPRLSRKPEVEMTNDE